MLSTRSPWKTFLMGVGFLFVVLSGTIDVPWAGANYPMIIGGLAIVVACGVSLAREGRCR